MSFWRGGGGGGGTNFKPKYTPLYVVQDLIVIFTFGAGLHCYILQLVLDYIILTVGAGLYYYICSCCRIKLLYLYLAQDYVYCYINIYYLFILFIS